ncbi:DUF6011 domain-containing protein [Kitasatospora sp. NPDC056076]|uniref:DUF6011 domain-containing protein n=1 Tax=Kitasatospora sp. NPDC056076 TaxID=3345703 RepID=UPI0035E1C6D3
MARYTRTARTAPEPLAPSVGAGRYALNGRAYRIDRPTEGRWAGYVFAADITDGDTFEAPKLGRDGTAVTLALLEALGEAGIAAAAATWAAKNPSAEEKPLPEIPDGRYALNERLFKVTNGKKPGMVFVDEMTSARGGRKTKLPLTAARIVLEDIAAAGIRECSVAFGKLCGVCGACGRVLTDPVSIKRGIGPICAENLGIDFDDDADEDQDDADEDDLDEDQDELDDEDDELEYALVSDYEDGGALDADAAWDKLLAEFGVATGGTDLPDDDADADDVLGDEEEPEPLPVDGPSNALVLRPRGDVELWWGLRAAASADTAADAATDGDGAQQDEAPAPGADSADDMADATRAELIAEIKRLRATVAELSAAKPSPAPKSKAAPAPRTAAPKPAPAATVVLGENATVGDYVAHRVAKLGMNTSTNRNTREIERRHRVNVAEHADHIPMREMTADRVAAIVLAMRAKRPTIAMATHKAQTVQLVAVCGLAGADIAGWRKLVDAAE